MSPAKVTLSPKELELVNNSDWILTKNAIIGKVYTLFGELSQAYTAQMKAYSFNVPGVDLASAKIAKGDQYEGLPWVMLDQPRHFTHTDTFAIRSFFWWGNFCSITLQLSGRFAQQYGAVAVKYFANKPSEGWHSCINADAWQHHFRADNYVPVAASGEFRFEERPFVKLAKKIPLTNWNALPAFYERSFAEIMEALRFE